MLTLAFVINIFAVVIFANFSDTADPESVGLESAGAMISAAFGNTVRERITGGAPKRAGNKFIGEVDR